jgi:hypothetical protein
VAGLRPRPIAHRFPLVGAMRTLACWMSLTIESRPCGPEPARRRALLPVRPRVGTETAARPAAHARAQRRHGSIVAEVRRVDDAGAAAVARQAPLRDHTHAVRARVAEHHRCETLSHGLTESAPMLGRSRRYATSCRPASQTGRPATGCSWGLLLARPGGRTIGSARPLPRPPP